MELASFEVTNSIILEASLNNQTTAQDDGC